MSTEIAASVSVVRNPVDQYVFAGHNQDLSDCEDHHRNRQPPKPGGAHEADFTQGEQNAADHEPVESACAFDEPAGERISDQDSGTID